METATLTAKGRATRERIVVAASRLILEQGTERTTLEDIQGAAKVGPSQLYHYFADKQELVMAVIDHQTELVVATQRSVLDRLDSFAALEEWRDLMVRVLRQLDCVGGCPVGSLASDLAETNPSAREALQRSFSRWEGLLREGLRQMQERRVINAAVDVESVALAMLAAVQGGLLLSQTRRETSPLSTAVDTMIAYLRSQAL